MWCFTLVSLTLIGIPPTSAFVQQMLSDFRRAVQVSWAFMDRTDCVLIKVRLLTAGYLLTISIKAFLGRNYNYARTC